MDLVEKPNLSGIGLGTSFSYPDHLANAAHMCMLADLNAVLLRATGMLTQGGPL